MEAREPTVVRFGPRSAPNMAANGRDAAAGAALGRLWSVEAMRSAIGTLLMRFEPRAVPAAPPCRLVAQGAEHAGLFRDGGDHHQAEKEPQRVPLAGEKARRLGQAHESERQHEDRAGGRGHRLADPVGPHHDGYQGSDEDDAAKDGSHHECSTKIY